jgi:N-acetylmuramoyl-L-alanine amidase
MVNYIGFLKVFINDTWYGRIMTIRKNKKINWVIALLTASFLTSFCLAKTSTSRFNSNSPQIVELKYWTGAESSQIAFYTKGGASYNLTNLPDKKGFIFYTSNAPLDGGNQSYTVRDGVIDRIDAQNTDNACRVTVTFMVPTDYTLSPGNMDRHYPVIEIMRPMNLRTPQPTPQQIAELKKNHKIILIDPGHGGWHFGAGGNGLLEKNITMEIGLKLQDKINRMPGYVAFITRDTAYNGGDYYVSLERRCQMSVEYGADLFISIHLNSPGNDSKKDVHGTEIYYMAYGEASDAEAQKLADLENSADLDAGATIDKGDVVNQVLQDERLIALNNQNSLFAGLVLNQALQGTGLTSRGVKNARFAVLKNAIPSILMEVVFVTNPREARLVNDPVFQLDLSDKISNAITQYFAINHGRPVQNAVSTDSTSTTLSGILPTPLN